MIIKCINKMCFQKLFNKNNIFFIFFSVTFVILIYLGSWQLYRLNAKNTYIDSVFKSIEEPVKTIDSIDQKNALYSKIGVKGVFLIEKAMWLYRRHPGAKYEDGAYLIIPIQDSKNRVFLSLIGWVKNNDKESILQEINERKEADINGILLFSEDQSVLLPRNDYKNKICFTLDVSEIAREMNLTLHEYFIAALSTQKMFKTKIYDITPNMMIKVRNDHLEYAATWFGLAAVLCYIYYYICLRRYEDADN